MPRPSPNLKKGVCLYDYQNQVCDWMKLQEAQTSQCEINGIHGGLVCLKQGLGKTLIALQHSISQQSRQQEVYPTLIVASLTVMYEWQVQGVQKFFDNINVLYFHKDFMGNYIDQITCQELLDYNIVITTYNVCLQICKRFDIHKQVCQLGEPDTLQAYKVVQINERQRPRFRPELCGQRVLYETPFNRIIADESQHFADPKTKTFTAMMSLYGRYKWCLTGTPLKNRDLDIWSQLRFCGYDRIARARLWKRRYFQQQELLEHFYVADYEMLQVELPEKRVYTHYVSMDANQERVYTALLKVTQDLYEQLLKKLVNYASVLAMFTRLRQTAIAPYLLVAKKTSSRLDKTIKEELEKNHVGRWVKDKNWTAGIMAPKISKIVQILGGIPAGEKILVFSMFVSCLELVEVAFKKAHPQVVYEFLDGRITGPERIGVIDYFKSDATVQVLFIHYKVGGEGINLPEASHVICIEPWWCPSVHDQAIARSWRRGQTKPVSIHWVFTQKTIEEPIMKLCSNKEQLAKNYFYGQYYKPVKTGLTKWELKRLLGICDILDID